MVVLFGILFEHGSRCMSGASKYIPKFFGKVAQTLVLINFTEYVVKKKRSSVLRSRCRCDTWISHLNDATGFLNIACPVKEQQVYNIFVFLPLWAISQRNVKGMIR